MTPTEALDYIRSYIERTHHHWDNDYDAKVGKRLLALGGRLPKYSPRLTEALEVVRAACKEAH